MRLRGTSRLGVLLSHRKLQLILSVYVDDFKLVGKTENLKAGWDLIMGSGLVLDPPTPLGDCLGCGQFPIHVSATEAQRRLEQVMPLLQQVDGIQRSANLQTVEGNPLQYVRILQSGRGGVL